MDKTSIFTVLTAQDLECKLCGKHVTPAGRAQHGNAHVKRGEAERIPNPLRIRFVAPEVSR